MESLKILITGSHGFIGTALCSQFEREGVVFDRVVRTQTHARSGECAPSESNCVAVTWPDDLRLLDLARYSTIIHLATPSGEDVAVEEHVRPVEYLEEAIQRSNPNCHLITLSSLSASPNAISNYGRGKWQVQEHLSVSKICWTILRPGLVVDTDNPRGLFGAIAKVVKLLPFIPVPDGADVTVQPVRLSDVIAGIMAIAASPSTYALCNFPLALPSRSLPQFVKDVASEFGMKRRIVTVPISAAIAGLQLIEAIAPRFPIRASNLQGLLYGERVSSSETEEKLNLKLSSFGEPLPDESPEAELAWEARYIFQILFRTAPSERIVRRYRDAHNALPSLLRSPEPSVRELVSRGYSLELLERTHRAAYPQLSYKFQLLSYLAEVDPRYASHFFLPKPARITAWLRLPLGVLRTASMLLQGRLLSKRLFSQKEAAS